MKLIVTLFAALVIAMAPGVGPTQADAQLLPGTNFDDLVLGAQVAPDLMTEFVTPTVPPTSIGTLTGRVWLHNGTYTYELVVAPSSNNPLEFNTGFGVQGFDPATHQVGWSHSDAAAAGAVNPARAFTIIRESDGTLDWNLRTIPEVVPNGTWSTGDRLVPMTFFFQSSLPPLSLGTYNLLATDGGFTENYAPAPPPAPTVIEIDVEPRSAANKIKLKRHERVDVAILTTDTFDAADVDPTTVRFGATGTEAAPTRWRSKDVDRDGDRDLVLRFRVEDTGIKCGDTHATLTGQTFSGEEFVGQDTIRTVCPKPKKPNHHHDHDDDDDDDDDHDDDHDDDDDDNDDDD